MGRPPRQPWVPVLVGGRDLDLTKSRWSSMSLTAASPLGVLVRPCSISQTADVDSPICAPISASVRSPCSLSSVMRDAQVLMQPSLRSDVNPSQRLTVTAFRENGGMPRPLDMPKDLSTPGKRCKWWRMYRQRTESKSKFQQGNFARSIGMKQGTLSDFENGHSDATAQLHLICAGLRLNAHYVQTGRGEPEASFPQEPPAEADALPFSSVIVRRLSKLTPVELHYAESKLLAALQEIENSRKSTGS